MTGVDQTWPVLVSGTVMEQGPEFRLTSKRLGSLRDRSSLALLMLGQSLPTKPISARVLHTRNKQLTLQAPRSPGVSHGPWLRAWPSGILSEPGRPLSLQTRRGAPAPWLPRWTGLLGVGRANRDGGCVRSSSYPRNGEVSGWNASYDP